MAEQGAADVKKEYDVYRDSLFRYLGMTIDMLTHSIDDAIRVHILRNFRIFERAR